MKYFLFLFSILSFSCTRPEINESTLGSNFFSINSFLKTEIEGLEKSGVQLRKTVTRNGKEETRVIQKPDYSIELSEFLNADISRPAWKDKYEKKEIENGFQYICTDDKLDIKEVNVQEIGEKTIIHIKKETENSLNQAEKNLQYETGKGFRIKNIRKSIGNKSLISFQIFRHINIFY